MRSSGVAALLKTDFQMRPWCNQGKAELTRYVYCWHTHDKERIYLEQIDLLTHPPLARQKNGWSGTLFKASARKFAIT